MLGNLVEPEEKSIREGEETVDYPKSLGLHYFFLSMLFCE
jgi:hypothetical protein